MTALKRAAPENAGWRHDTEGPDDMRPISDHADGDLAAYSGAARALALGIWQAIYLIEHRARPPGRDRAAIYRQH